MRKIILRVENKNNHLNVANRKIQYYYYEPRKGIEEEATTLFDYIITAMPIFPNIA